MHTTVNIVLQGAYAQLLCAMTGRRDVAFGTTVSGRPAELPGAESMVGLLINTVPVRATITSATTTADLLDQLHRAHNQTLDHQHLALSDIHRITGHEQLFDTLFVYENYPIDTTAPLGVDGLAITEFTHREYNHYPLAIQALPGTELGLRVEYDTDVFDTADIDTLFERFTQLLAAMTTDPTTALSSIDVLDAAEHARLDGWGNRAVLTAPAPTPVSIPAVFATQVARTPHAVALTYGQQCLTYRELDAAANRLAHLLTDHGAGPGPGVALLMPRSARRDRGHPGGAQNRGGLPAHRPRTTRPADRLHPRRRHPDRRDHHHRVTPPPTRTQPRRHRHQRPHPRHPTRHRTTTPRPPRHRLPDLHLGHHRHPQRRRHHPPQRHPTHEVTACDPCPRQQSGRNGIPWPSMPRSRRSSVRCWMVGDWWWYPSR